jgi:CDP-glucose 4,6-dehydratase
MGTVHLLEAVRQAGGVPAVVIVTSDKCYENREWLWGYREDEPMGGSDPYSSSKACAELVTAAYRHSYFSTDSYSSHRVAIATARAGNVIGGGDWSRDRLVPDVLQACIQKKSVQLRNPSAIRPWQHVLEPLSGYLQLAEALYRHGPAFAEAWNFGPYESSVEPVVHVVERLLGLWGNPAGWCQDPTTQAHEAISLKLDSTKAHTRLKWRPRLMLDQALAWVVDWTRAWYAGEDMRRITNNQIQRYMELL